MNLSSCLRSRTRALFRRSRLEGEKSAELQSHLKARTANRVWQRGPRLGLRRVRLEFGGLDQVKEECREVGGSGVAASLCRQPPCR